MVDLPVVGQYGYNMDLCSELCLTCLLVVLHGKNVNDGHYYANCSTRFFLPAMLVGTIDFYHFIPLPLALPLPSSHKVNAKQNLLASFSPTLFI